MIISKQKKSDKSETKKILQNNWRCNIVYYIDKIIDCVGK